MGIRRITGAIKAPLIICWLFFIIQFAYMGVVHGILHFYINLTDLILDVVLLFTMETIAVLLTLSNNNNSRPLFKAALFISIITVIVIILSILIIVFGFFIKVNSISFLKPETTSNFNEKWKGIGLIVIRVFETLPLIIISIYLSKLDRPTGSIISPQSNNGDELLKDSSDILE